MPRLQQAIDAMPVNDHLTFLITAQGKPFSAAGFGNWFRDVCRDAGLPTQCTSHGLRKAAATYLAENSATDHELMAWFGWSSISQAQVYTKAANRKKMAQNAAQFISGTGIGSPSDPVSQNGNQVVDIATERKMNWRSRIPTWARAVEIRYSEFKGSVLVESSGCADHRLTTEIP